MRAVGIDLGARRVGVAVSDSGGLVATPYEMIDRAGEPSAYRARVAEIVREVAAERVVVGLPLSLDGSQGPAAAAALEEAEALRAVVGVPVECHDERLTTVSAQRSLASAGVGGRRRRQVVDQAAAAVLLQDWLDSRRAHP